MVLDITQLPLQRAFNLVVRQTPTPLSWTDYISWLMIFHRVLFKYLHRSTKYNSVGEKTLELLFNKKNLTLKFISWDCHIGNFFYTFDCCPLFCIH